MIMEIAMKEIWLSGYVGDEFTPAKTAEALKDFNGEDVKINLNTAGGSVYDGVEIFNVLNQYPGKKTVLMGSIVASIGSYISTVGDKVIAQDFSVFMIHNVKSGMWGDSEELKKEAENMDRLNERIADRLSKRSGKPVSEILNMMKEETWLYGKEIVNAGFADELLETGKSNSKEIAVSIARKRFNQIKNNIITNNDNKNNYRGDDMEKDELLKKINSMRVNGDITLKEIADAMGLKDQIVTDKHTNALKVVASFEGMNIPDPVAAYNGLLSEVGKNADKVRNAIISESFGVPILDKDGKDTNYLRAYAVNMIGKKDGEELVKAVNAVKEDPLAKKLASDAMDPHSKENTVNFSEKGSDKKENGIIVVDY